MVVRDTIEIWSRVKASRMAAGLAYYTMLSLAPLLVIAVAVAGVFYGDQLAQSELLLQIEAVTSPQIADTAAMILRNSAGLSGGIFAGLVSLFVLLFGASGAFSQLYDTMNVIWGVAPDKRLSWQYTLKQRALGILMVIAVGLLLVAALLFGTTVSILNSYVGESLPVLMRWLSWAHASSAVLVLPLIFMVLFRYIPAKPVAWRDVWLGGLLTGALFFLSRAGISLYLRTSTVTTAYGAAGSLVVLLIWVYFSGMILFLGTSFCKAYAEEFGSFQAQEGD